MFVINLKLNMKKIFIISGLLLISIAVLFEINSNTSKISPVNSNNPKYDYNLNTDNFSTILESIHSNIDENVNKTITLKGFVFKLPDFKEDIFVCGRNIIINNEEKIAGILCKSDLAKDLKENEWVEVSGIILSGEYVEKMPIIQVNSLKKIEALDDEYVE